jgi:hypothetical protein
MPSTQSVLVIVLLVVASMLIGASSADAARKPKQPSGFVVLDSSDPPKQVGKIIHATRGLVQVAFSVDGNLVAHSITEIGFNSRKNLFFTLPNCLGVAYFEADNIDSIPTQLGSVIGATGEGNPSPILYLEQPGSEITFVDTDMYILEGDSAFCEFVPSKSQTFVVMEPKVDLDALFTPPFTVVGDAPTLP